MGLGGDGAASGGAASALDLDVVLRTAWVLDEVLRAVFPLDVFFFAVLDVLDREAGFFLETFFLEVFVLEVFFLAVTFLRETFFLEVFFLAEAFFLVDFLRDDEVRFFADAAFVFLEDFDLDLEVFDFLRVTARAKSPLPLADGSPIGME